MRNKMIPQTFLDWRDAGGKPRGVPASNASKAAQVPRPNVPLPPPLPQGAKAPADAVNFDPGATKLAPSGKKQLGAFAADAAETFSSKGMKLPAEPGSYSVMKAPEGDFEVQVARGANGAGPATTAIAVKANAGGDVVALGADGQLTIGGQAAVAGDAPQALPGGGSVTNWGAGFVTVDSAAGDSVSAFAKGDRVEFMGQLADTRGPGAMGAPARVTEGGSLVS